MHEQLHLAVETDVAEGLHDRAVVELAAAGHLAELLFLRGLLEDALGVLLEIHERQVARAEVAEQRRDLVGPLVQMVRREGHAQRRRLVQLGEGAKGVRMVQRLVRVVLDRDAHAQLLGLGGMRLHLFEELGDGRLGRGAGRILRSGAAADDGGAAVLLHPGHLVLELERPQGITGAHADLHAVLLQQGREGFIAERGRLLALVAMDLAPDVDRLAAGLGDLRQHLGERGVAVHRGRKHVAQTEGLRGLGPQGGRGGDRGGGEAGGTEEIAAGKHGLTSWRLRPRAS